MSVAGSLIIALIGLVLLASVDYSWELPTSIRSRTVVIAGTLILIACLAWCVRAYRRWSRSAVAGELETTFPELGQRIRTMIEFAPSVPARAASDHRSAADESGRLTGYSTESESGTQITTDRSEDHAPASGVAPALVAALARQVDEQTRTLDFHRIVPYRFLWGLSGILACFILLLGVSAAANREWKTALARALGREAPYTQIHVQPGNVDLDQGHSLPIEFQIQGRQRSAPQLQWRAAGKETDWTTDLIDHDGTASDNHTRKFEAQLREVREPLEYRVVAGPVASPVYHIELRYPLVLQQVHTTIEPPSYTGLAKQSFPDGNINGLAGSVATFSIELDRKPISASVQLSRVGELSSEEERLVARPVEIEGTLVTWRMPLEHDLTWTLSARSQEGTSLPEKRFRVRVRPDQPPEVYFQQPESSAEVHTLAEVLMRIQASDDFGLTRSGIVFQINNLEEHTLLEEDFAQTAKTAAEVQQTGHLTPRTRAVLERVLPLEYFSLTQKDAVTYYGFAEDNYPGQAQQTRTDLRFIDIRPFRVEYEESTGQPRSGVDGTARGRLPTALDELIRRERLILNRTMKLPDQKNGWKQREINAVDELLQEQGLLAALTRELADFTLEFAAAEEVDTLYRAEASMLAAVDSLSLGNLEAAAVQEKDAQQYLVEGRNQLRMLLRRSLFARQAFRRANERLQSRLFRNRTDSQRGQELVSRLVRLAQEENSLTQLAAELSIPQPQQSEAAAEQRQVSLVDLENRQYDVTTEAHDVLKVFQQVEDLNELVQLRMKTATDHADTAATALGAGEFQSAATEISDAAHGFEELAVHVATLTAADFSRRVAETSLLTGELSQSQRELIRMLQQSSATKDSRNPMELSSTLQRLRSRAETVSDLVNDLMMFQDPNAGTGPDEVSRLAKQQKVVETLSRIRSATEKIDGSSGSVSSDVLSELEDTRERGELIAAALNQLFRKLVMPRLARLREFEARATELSRQMELMHSEEDIHDWNRALRELIPQLADEQAAGPAREELSQLLQQNQLPPVQDWQKEAGKLSPPGGLSGKMARMTEELRRQILELVLADFHHHHEEPVPPAYTRLVNTYLQILSTNQ